jgi:flagellar biosynthesis chaperone FliJ
LSKRLLKDLTTKSHDELAIEYAKSYVNKENPASVRNLLIMDAYKVLHEQGAYSMGEKQQAEVSDFIMALQDISQKKDYSLSSAATKSGSSFSRSDWYATPNITIDSYLAMVQDKIK